MTENEAIKELHKIRHRGGIIPQKRAEALDVAIQALEKQIPTKVQLRHIRKFDGFDEGECPTCGWTVSRDCDGADNFCLDCGQKLDWGDDEE